MKNDYTISKQPATAEHVRRVFEDWHRRSAAYGDADADFELTFDTTIAEWRDASDLLDWRQFAAAMNKGWEIHVPLPEWRNVLVPAKKRTIRGICDLIAREAMVPKLKPATILGAPCMASGAFLTVREMLRNAGADVRKLAPSTRLDEYARRYPRIFTDSIVKLAPGALPPAKINFPVYEITIIGALIGSLLLFMSIFVSNPWFRIFAVALFGASYLTGWVVALCKLPRKVTFGELVTFKDLARTIVENLEDNSTAARCP